jgi:hypothetical protein
MESSLAPLLSARSAVLAASYPALYIEAAGRLGKIAGCAGPDGAPLLVRRERANYE